MNNSKDRENIMGFQMQRSLEEIVQDQVLPFYDKCFAKISQFKSDWVVENIRVMDDPFILGQLITYYSEILEFRNAADFYLPQIKELIELAVDKKIETWGIYSFLNGLYNLKLGRYLNQVLDAEMATRLKEKLDWRTFINEDNLDAGCATNYYIVAMRIAGFRSLLGWGDDEYVIPLCQKALERSNNIEFGYFDETKGHGRFDGYSFVLPFEIYSMLKILDMEIPDMLLKLLENSYKIYKQMVNRNGFGLPYGRSIGAHSDLQVASVLSHAAELYALDDQLRNAYYAYAVNAVEKYLDFWFDSETGMINLWDNGRRTDYYRNKSRIIEVNLGCRHYILNIYRTWKAMNMNKNTPVNNFLELVEPKEKNMMFTLEKGEYERALIIVRNMDSAICLPLINGGDRYFKTAAYLPTVFSPLLFEAPADEDHPNLVPLLKLKSGREVMPISYFKNIRESDGDNYRITYEVDEMCDGDNRSKYKGIKSQVSFEFSDGMISRTERFITVDISDPIRKIRMDFALFSETATIYGNSVSFKNGRIFEFTIDGFDSIAMEDVSQNNSYSTNHGQLKSNIVCEKKLINSDIPIVLKWSIKYR